MIILTFFKIFFPLKLEKLRLLDAGLYYYLVDQKIFLDCINIRKVTSFFLIL